MSGAPRGRRPVVVERRTRLDAPASEVWQRVTTAEGIADELRPWLRMTTPPGLRDRAVADVPVGVALGRAWILLAGVLPVEYDDLVLVDLGPRHFQERSRTGALAEWVHRREVLDEGGDVCVVHDSLRATPRVCLRLLPGSGRLVEALVATLFSHRHRRLARWAARR